MQAPKKAAPIKEALRVKAASAAETPAEVSIDQPAIENGRKPLTTRRKDATAIKSKAAELYGIPSTGVSAMQPIEAAFKFAAVEGDSQFHFLQAERLLEQASGILDRCSTLRTRRDALQIEKWKLQLELDRFFKLDSMSERERESGLDTVQYERAAYAAAAEAALEAHHKSAEAQLKGLSDDLLAGGFNKRMAARELAAWLSAYPLKDSELRGDDAVYTFDGARKTKPEHLFDAARLEADEAAWEQATELMARRFAAAASAESARLRKEGFNREAKLALASIAAKRAKAEAERDVVWEKAYQAQCPNGLLNYHNRIARIEREFASEFREALAQLAAARRGLKELYGYVAAFPEEGSPGHFDEVVAWTGRAKNHVAQWARMEQTYVLAVSVKELAKGQWDAGRSTGEWSFDLPEDLFKGQAQVRLRGIGAAVVGSSDLPDSGAAKSKGTPKGEPQAVRPEGFWSARVRVPAAGTLRHSADKVVEIDQKLVPVCCLGRVADRGASWEPEIAGASVVHNASPIGKQWSFSLSPKSTDGTATDKLQDVLLYLRVAVRAS